MDPRPSGWYDDPQEPTRIRYWDGAEWTDRYADKAPMPAPAPPRREDPRAGRRGSEGPAPREGEPAAPVADAGPSASPAAPAQSAPSPVPPGRDEPPRPAYGAPAPGAGPGAGRPDAVPGFPSPSRPGVGGAPGRASGLAADGVPLAGFGRRVLAHVVDYVIVIVIVSIVMAPFLGATVSTFEAWFSSAQAAVGSGAPAPEIPAELLRASVIVSLLQAAAFIGYEVALLPRRGTTPGRRVAGVRVRMLGEDRPPEAAAAMRRSVLKYLAHLASGIPLIGQIAFAFMAVDWLWPLRDPGRQALHDKAATTQVVRAARA